MDGKKLKYKRMLVTIPDEIYKDFSRLVPQGSRSRTIVNLIRRHLSTLKKSKSKDNFWRDFDKYRKHDYGKLDLNKVIEDAWNDVD